jgi:hypothetical protein
MKRKLLSLCLAGTSLGLMAGTVNAATLIDLNFNSGTDAQGQSQGNLVFKGADGFQVSFTDDDSNGSKGGNADGVHITNQNYGNKKVGSSDLVLGANNSSTGSNNYHSSGIVGIFNCGVEQVRLFDTDDDGTKKTLFAFDKDGNLIGKTNAASQTTFQIDTSMTGGKLIHKIEFDTEMGTSGGSLDNTVFTIDDFHVEGQPCKLPQPQDCNAHATYSVEKGRLTIPFIDMPLLEPDTHKPTDKVRGFQVDLKQQKNSIFINFTVVPNSVKFVLFTPTTDACRAVYSSQDKTLKIPFVDVGSKVYEFTLKHVQEVPLDLGVLRLESYNYLHTIK